MFSELHSIQNTRVILLLINFKVWHNLKHKMCLYLVTAWLIFMTKKVLQMRQPLRSYPSALLNQFRMYNHRLSKPHNLYMHPNSARWDIPLLISSANLLSISFLDAKQTQRESLASLTICVWRRLLGVFPHRWSVMRWGCSWACLVMITDGCRCYLQSIYSQRKRLPWSISNDQGCKKTPAQLIDLWPTSISQLVAV